MQCWIAYSLAITLLTPNFELALAGQYGPYKKNVVVEDVRISEEVAVLVEPNGSFLTKPVVIVGTTTIENTFPALDRMASTTVTTSAAQVQWHEEAHTQYSVEVPFPISSTSTLLAATSHATALSGLIRKRGLAYNDIALLSGFLRSGSHSSWCYNWESNPNGIVPPGVEYVPMLWGLDSKLTSTWDVAVKEALQLGSIHLLSFNEPDLGPPNAQSNIHPQDAADGYYEYTEKYAGRARLGSPAVTNGDPSSGMGLGWLARFLETCQNLGCTVDFIAIHWYGDDTASNVQNFKEHTLEAYAAGGHRPVWITEFGVPGSTAYQQAFLEEVIPWLDSQTFVERYAYFMVSNGSLISGNEVSALGYTYAFL